MKAFCRFAFLPILLTLWRPSSSAGVEKDAVAKTLAQMVDEFNLKEKEYYAKLGKKGDNKCDVYYDPANGKCAYWNEEAQRYERPALEYDIVDANTTCISYFHKRIFSPSCGDPNYEQLKHCAKVQFFDNKKPEDGGINNDNKNRLLLMVDGCLVCLVGTEDIDRLKSIKVTLQLSYNLPAGSFFTSCDDITMKTDEISLTLDVKNITKAVKSSPKGKSGEVSVSNSSLRSHFKSIDTSDDDYVNEEDEFDPNEEDMEKKFVEEPLAAGQRHFLSFAMPMVVLQRECRGLFMMDKPKGKFYNMTLKVEHNCKEENSVSPMLIPMAETVKLKRFKDNVGEVRGLYINLGANAVYQFSMVGNKYKVIKHSKEEAYHRKAVEFGNKKILKE
uniref:Uncharacterized protein n=1 Tax=Globodera pallida TaxID=36090 RepID=A0A183BJ32_GLOPA